MRTSVQDLETQGIEYLERNSYNPYYDAHTNHSKNNLFRNYKYNAVQHKKRHISQRDTYRFFTSLQYLFFPLELNNFLGGSLFPLWLRAMHSPIVDIYGPGQLLFVLRTNSPSRTESCKQLYSVILPSRAEQLSRNQWMGVCTMGR